MVAGKRDKDTRSGSQHGSTVASTAVALGAGQITQTNAGRNRAATKDRPFQIRLTSPLRFTAWFAGAQTVMASYSIGRENRFLSRLRYSCPSCVERALANDDESRRLLGAGPETVLQELPDGFPQTAPSR